MVSPNRRIKLFNRVLKEFVTDYNSVYDKKETLKAQDILYLDTFRDEVNMVKEDFFNCNSEVLSRVSICKQLSLDTMDISGNTHSLWNYLHTLYMTTIESSEEKQLIVVESKKSLEKLGKRLTESDFDNLPLPPITMGLLKDARERMPYLKKIDISKIDISKVDINSIIAKIIDPIMKNPNKPEFKEKIVIGDLDITEILNTVMTIIEEKTTSKEIENSELMAEFLGFIQKIPGANILLTSFMSKIKN